MSARLLENSERRAATGASVAPEVQLFSCRVRVADWIFRFCQFLISFRFSFIGALLTILSVLT
jgi:hypothetical protein